MLSLGIVLLISYLIGSIPSSLWTGRFVHKIDIREYGSGNAGATNTFRILGWKSGTFVLLFDFSKGLVCTLFVSKLAYDIGSGPVQLLPNWDVDASLVILCGMMAVVGHMYPIFAGFVGGKGAATAAGMLYGVEPLSISITLVVFILVIYFSRYVSLGSIVASAIYPASQLILRYGFGWEIDGSIIIFSSVVALGIIVKHKANIKRLMDGTESKVESFKPGKGKLQKEGLTK